MSSVSEESELYECPWDECSRDDFTTERGMKIHHSRVHGESIAGVRVECAWCGKDKRVDNHLTDRNERFFCGSGCKGAWQSENISGEEHHCWKPLVMIECEACGEGFEVEAHAADGRRFCSNQCGGLAGKDNPMWDGGKEATECDHCSSVYHVDPCDVDGTRFCSEKCKHQWQSEHLVGAATHNWKGGMVTDKCEYCGGEYEIYPAVADNQRFCSRECFGKWYRGRYAGEQHHNWGGGDLVYGEGWTERKRRLVRKRDGHVCRVCGKTESTHLKEHGKRHTVHHIIPARRVEDVSARNSLPNLVAICSEHHNELEELAYPIQLRAFLPHPPRPTEQSKIAQFGSEPAPEAAVDD